MRGFFCQVTDQSILIRKEIGASRREVFWGTNWLTLNLAVAHFFCVLVPSSSFSLYSFIIYGELFGCFPTIPPYFLLIKTASSSSLPKGGIVRGFSAKSLISQY